MKQPLARALVAAVVVLAGLGMWTSTASAIDDQNCSDFSSQQAAQVHLRQDPTDPDRLDADNDGIACESNPGPFDFNRVVRTSAVGVVAAPTTPVAAVATSGDLQGSHIVSFSAGTVTTTNTARAASTLPRTGLNHLRQLVELALVFIGLGTALVIGRRPGVIR